MRLWIMAIYCKEDNEYFEAAYLRQRRGGSRVSHYSVVDILLAITNAGMSNEKYGGPDSPKRIISP